MPLVLFVGWPASGKTTRAKQLLAHLEQHLFPHKATPAAAAADDSKQPVSSTPPSSSVVSTDASPSPPSPLLSSFSSPATADEVTDNSTVTQLSALSLSTAPSHHPAIANPPLSSSTTTPSSTSDSTFTKSTTPPKPIKPSPSHSSPSPSSSASPITDLVLINHETLQLPRSSFYTNLTSEKQGRSAIRSTIEHQLTSSRILLVDYLNDIKGFRYELWCRAREVGTTYCVVYCVVGGADGAGGKERCMERNKKRPVDEQYSDAVMADLLGRMEVPNGTKRWDEPLFTVGEDDNMPLEQITQWVLHGKQQNPGLATLPAQLEDISYLQTLERTLNNISQSLIDRQQRQLIHAGDAVTVAGSSVKLQLVRAVKYAELKRIQGQFVKIVRLRPMQGEAAIATSFVTHLQNALNY